MELSEPERTTARFQAVVSSLLAPGRGAQLFAHSPLEVQLQVGADTQRGVPALAQVLLTAGDDAAALQVRLQPLLEKLVASRAGDEDGRFYLRIIVVTTVAEAKWVDATLRALTERAPAAPALQVFQVSSDGTVSSPSSLMFSEVGPALHEQAKQPLVLKSAAEFAALCEQAAAKTRVNESQVRDFAQVLQARRAPVTYGLLGLNLLMFALTYLWGGTEHSATFYRMGAVDPQAILAGQWWRLLAATTLHDGVAHLLGNSLVLWVIGVFLERLLGSARFLSLYVLAGLLGNLLAPALSWMAHFSMSVGASGAICGLLAAGGALGLRPRGDLPESIAQKLKLIALVMLAPTVLSSVQPHVDWRAHLGGAIAGGLLTLSGLLRPTVQASSAPRWQRLHGALATFCAGLLLLSIGSALRHGQPWLITHPSALQRVYLPGTALSIEVPRSLGNGRQGSTGEESTARIFDDRLASPVMLLILTERNSIPLVEPADRERFAQTKWQPYTHPAPGSPESFAAHELPINGLPTLAVTGSLPKCERMQALLQIQRDYTVTLELCLPTDLPQRLIPELPQLLSTLREEAR